MTISVSDPPLGSKCELTLRDGSTRTGVYDGRSAATLGRARNWLGEQFAGGWILYREEHPGTPRAIDVIAWRVLP